jgi:archaellum component FlaC
MESDFRKTLEGKLKQLRAELEERTASIPIHSMRPHQLIRIEELEEEINEIEEKLDQEKSSPS